jgi:hypothetical protein
MNERWALHPRRRKLAPDYAVRSLSDAAAVRRAQVERPIERLVPYEGTFSSGKNAVRSDELTDVTRKWRPAKRTLKRTFRRPWTAGTLWACGAMQYHRGLRLDDRQILPKMLKVLIVIA